MITTLTSYIHGHVTLTEGSPSLIKVAPKRVATHSRPAIGKKKVTKMYESESSSSTDDEEARTTLGAELTFGVLSSELLELTTNVSI